jgi:hypothetical protein
MLRPTVSRPVCLSVKPHLGPKTKFLLPSDSCGFDVGRPLWRVDGCAVYNCFWSSSAQPFSGPSPAGLMTIFYCFRFETHPKPGRPGPRVYIPQEQGGLVIPPGTGFPFRRLLRLAGLRWRCSNRLHAVIIFVNAWSLCNMYFSPYRTGNTLHLPYKAQPVNAV